MNGKRAKALRRQAALEAAAASLTEEEVAALAAALGATQAPLGVGRARRRSANRMAAELRTRRRLAAYLGGTPDPSVTTADLAAQVSRKSATHQRSRRAQ